MSAGFRRAALLAVAVAAVAAIAVLPLATAYAALPPIALHPINCKYCHAAQNNIDLPWNHVTYGREDVWLRCIECHQSKFIGGLGTSRVTEGYASVADAILNPNNVHFRVGCKCHAVLHMGYDNNTGSWAAWVFFYTYNLTKNVKGYTWPLINNGTVAYRPPPVYLLNRSSPSEIRAWENLFNGTSPFIYNASRWLSFAWIPWVLVCYDQPGKTGAVLLQFTYNKNYPGILFTDWVGNYTRYLYGEKNLTFTSACQYVIELADQLGAVKRAVSVGFYDPFLQKFIPIRGSAGDWGVYDDVGQRNPARACYICHFIAKNPAQIGVYKYEGGVLKIGIPKEALNLPPHQITWQMVQEIIAKEKAQQSLAANMEGIAGGIAAALAAALLALRKLLGA